MKFFKNAALGFFVLFVFVIYIEAQTQIANPASLSPTHSQCDSALLDRADYTFRLRSFRCNSYEAESLLKKILDICPNSHFLFETQKKLVVINEEKSQKNLDIANFYWSQDASVKLCNFIARL